MEDLRRAFGVLGNRRRFKILISLLQSGEHTVGGIALYHKMHITTVSKHLRKLETVGLLKSRRQGTSVYYSADTLSRSAAIRGILGIIRSSPKRRIK